MLSESGGPSEPVCHLTQVGNLFQAICVRCVRLIQMGRLKDVAQSDSSDLSEVCHLFKVGHTKVGHQ